MPLEQPIINQEITVSQEDSKRDESNDNLISLNAQFNVIGLGLSSQDQSEPEHDHSEHNNSPR